MKLKSYKGIADRYVIRSKKRTILNVIAIALAIGLFVSIATFVKSSEETQLESMKKQVGDFEVSFNDIPSDKAEVLLKNVELKDQGIVELKKVLPIDNTNETIELCKYDEETINNIYTFDMLEGRLPEKNNELVITEKTRDTVENMKLGNKVKINNVEYDIVGVKTENRYSKINPNAGFTYLDRKDINKENKYSVICNVKEKSGKVKVAQKVAKDLGLDESVVGVNTRVVSMVDPEADNDISNAVYYFVAIVYVIIVIATVAVIYNSFNISVTEKISQYGMLRAIGAAPNQIRYLVLKEGFISWLLALPIGLVGGIGALKLVVYIISHTMESGTVAFDMNIGIYLTPIILSSVISLVSVLISVLGPAITAGKVSIIDTIRNPGNLNIKTQKIKKRKSIISKLLFGFEGDLAYKNVKRNNKRFIITVLSLILSLLMFNTFTSMVLGLKGGLDTIMAKANYDGEMVFRDPMVEIDENLINKIKENNDVEHAYVCKEIYVQDLSLEIDKKYVNEKYAEKFKEISKKDTISETESGKYKIKLTPVGMDDNGIKFIKDKDGKLNIDKLSEDEVILVNTNSMGLGNVSSENMFKYNVGDMINVPSYKGNNEKSKEFKIAAIIEYNSHNPYPMPGQMEIIFNEKAYAQLFNPDNTGIYIDHKEDSSNDKERERLEKLAQENKAIYSDLEVMEKQNNEVFLQIGIFAYGFIAVITIISIVNIINTVSMNILTRKKEFGIIKAIGMHQGQLRKMISIEGILSGLYASVIGSILSFFIMKWIINLYSEQVGMTLDTPYWIIIVSGIFVLLITYVAALIPLRKLKNINLVESIKEE